MSRSVTASWCNVLLILLEIEINFDIFMYVKWPGYTLPSEFSDINYYLFEIRALALYSTVDDSSNVLESCPTRKKN